MILLDDINFIKTQFYYKNKVFGFKIGVKCSAMYSKLVLLFMKVIYSSSFFTDFCI